MNVPANILLQQERGTYVAPTIKVDRGLRPHRFVVGPDRFSCLAQITEWPYHCGPPPARKRPAGAERKLKTSASGVCIGQTKVGAEAGSQTLFQGPL